MQTDLNWQQMRRRQEEGKKRILAGWSFSTLGKHSAGRLLMFFLVFNHRSVWRGCCDLDNNFLKHIYIPNFFLSWVNQHAICNAPGGNLWKVSFFLPLLSLQKVRTTQHPFSLELPVNASPNPQALQRKNKGESCLFPACALSSLYSTGWRRERGEHSALGVSLGGKEETVFTRAAARSPSSHASVTRPNRCPPGHSLMWRLKTMEQCIYSLVTG